MASKTLQVIPPSFFCICEGSPNHAHISKHNGRVLIQDINTLWHALQEANLKGPEGRNFRIGAITTTKTTKTEKVCLVEILGSAFLQTTEILTIVNSSRCLYLQNASLTPKKSNNLNYVLSFTPAPEESC